MLLFEAIALCMVADLAARALSTHYHSYILPVAAVLHISLGFRVGFVGILIRRLWTKSISSSSPSFSGA